MDYAERFELATEHAASSDGATCSGGPRDGRGVWTGGHTAGRTTCAGSHARACEGRGI